MPIPLSLRVVAIPALLATAFATGAHAAPTTANGYALTTFANAPTGSSAPDSIAYADGRVYVGYGNGGDPTGAGATSTIAEYSHAGALLGTTSVAGHNDGLRFDAGTGQLWAIQNEDANATLITLNPATLAQSPALSFSAAPHQGGYDDVAFLNGQAYVSASNPTGNTAPAIAKATIANGQVQVSGIINDNATVTNKTTGAPTTLNLTDPDSLIPTPTGQLLLTSQGDQQLIYVTNPGQQNQSASVLDLAYMVDDTSFAPGADSTLLFSNKGTNQILALTGPFAAGQAFSSGQSPDGTQNIIGLLNQQTGDLTPVVSGLGNPGGSAFIPTSVPEPGSIAILGAGLLGLLTLTRRRNA